MNSDDDWPGGGRRLREGAAGRSAGQRTFEEERPGLVRRAQHFLHAYPTTIPFIVLLLGVVLLQLDRRRQVLRAVQPVADPAAGHDHRDRSASRRPW